MIDRERRTVERRIKEASFSAVKSLDSFDFAAIPSFTKTLVLELARSEYIARRENIIAVGNSGTGKTHVALGLGLAACKVGQHSTGIGSILLPLLATLVVAGETSRMPAWRHKMVRTVLILKYVLEQASAL